MKKIVCLFLSVILIVCLFSGCSKAMSFSEDSELFDYLAGVWAYDSPTCSDTVYLFVENGQVYVAGANDIQSEIKRMVEAHANQGQSSFVHYDWEDCADALYKGFISGNNMTQSIDAECKKGIVNLQDYSASGFHFAGDYDTRTILRLRKNGCTIQEDAADKANCPLKRISTDCNFDLQEFQIYFQSEKDSYDFLTETYSGDWHTEQDGTVCVGTFYGSYTTNAPSKSGTYSMSAKIEWQNEVYPVSRTILNFRG